MHKDKPSHALDRNLAAARAKQCHAVHAPYSHDGTRHCCSAKTATALEDGFLGGNRRSGRPRKAILKLHSSQLATVIHSPLNSYFCALYEELRFVDILSHYTNSLEQHLGDGRALKEAKVPTWRSAPRHACVYTYR